MLIAYSSFLKSIQSIFYKTFSKTSEVTVGRIGYIPDYNPVKEFNPELIYIGYNKSEKKFLGSSSLNIVEKNDSFYKPEYFPILNQELIFHVFNKPSGGELSPIYETSSLNISVKKSLFNKETELIFNPSTIDISVKETDLGGGGSLGKLEMLLEVQRLEEKRVKLPKGYLDGLKPSNIARREGDTLIIWSPDFGESTLYTDKGTIVIRTVPGYRINKSKEATVGFN